MSLLMVPSKYDTLEHLIAGARACQDHYGLCSITPNYYAGAIQELSDAAILNRQVRHNTVQRLMEEGMLQIGFIHRAVNPGAAFISAAYLAGWRYNLVKGFYRA